MKNKALHKLEWKPWLVAAIAGLFLLLGVPAIQAAEEEEEAEPEEPDNTLFEGGSRAFTNWIEFSMGGFITDGNRAQAEDRHRLNQGMFGGIQDLHFQQEIATNTIFTLDGHSIFGNHDYALGLGIMKPDLWFVRVNFENFRTWYNDDGGYYPPADKFYSRRGDALALDRGEISFEAGLTLPNKPALTFRYSRQYRDGGKSSTIWGQAHPFFDAPMPTPEQITLTRGVNSSFHEIDEVRDTFELDVRHRIKKTDVGLGVRYETGDFDNALKITQFPGEPTERFITDRQGLSYDLFSAHAFTETWLKQNLFFSTGFLYSRLWGEPSGSRIHGDDFDVAYTPNAMNGLGYTDLDGSMDKSEYVMNLNLMAIPKKNFVIVPSLRVRKEDWDADTSGLQTSGAGAPISRMAESEGDSLDVTEQLDVRYTGFTNWVLYARGEWTQGEGSLDETNGFGTTPLIRRETEDTRFFQKYSAGVRWYPQRWLTVDAGGYYKKHEYDYDHDIDSTGNAAGNRYPAYFVMQDFETYDANLRLTLRPRRNVTLVSRYEYQLSTINTAPDPASGLSGVESAEMTSHIFAQNVSWVPWSRLSLQAGVNYVLSETETPVSDYVPPTLTAAPVLEAQNNYLTLNFNSTFVVSDKMDLNVGYFYYLADNYQNNADVGLPLGSGAEEHGVTVGVVHRIRENLRLTLKYGYYTYSDDLSGGHNDYDAHVLFSALQYRF